MERNVNTDGYLTLDMNSIAAVENIGKEEAEGNEYPEGTLVFPDTEYRIDELYFDKENQSIAVSGTLHIGGREIGYFSPEIPIGNETITEFIEFCLKKIGKLKTVLEALK